MPLNAPNMKIIVGINWSIKCDMNWYFCFESLPYLSTFVLIPLFIYIPI